MKQIDKYDLIGIIRFLDSSSEGVLGGKCCYEVGKQFDPLFNLSILRVKY